MITEVDILYIIGGIDMGNNPTGHIVVNGIILNSNGVYIGIFPYQEYDKDIQFGTVIDTAGPLAESDATSYFINKYQSCFSGHKITKIQKSNCKLDITSIVKWNNDDAEDSILKQNSGAIVASSQFGMLHLFIPVCDEQEHNVTTVI